MSGETAREFSDRVTAESLADHYQTGSTLNEYLARAVAERDQEMWKAGYRAAKEADEAIRRDIAEKAL